LVVVFKSFIAEQELLRDYSTEDAARAVASSRFTLVGRSSSEKNPFDAKIEAPWLVVIVVVLVPIVFGAPAVLVFVPPAMLLAPATLASFVQFATLVIGLPAMAAMFLDGLVEFMVGVSDSTLTAVDVFRVKPW
jgi:hypothetical protein